MPSPKQAETPGGAFLLPGATAPAEPKTDDAQTLGQAARDFVRERVLPRNAQLEAGDRPLLRELIREAGKLGLLGCEIPIGYGGLGAPAASANAVVSGLGLHASFAVTAAAHLTIGAVPLLRHASPALCAELLPSVASGERIGAYALTEPASGSDALHLSTRAVERAGRWAITGSKQFITNAAIADQFVVFALVEGAGPTAFLLDARTPGLQLGKEERKLGLHGSSTCALHLDGAEVPAERVVGAIGHGHRVALDALTVGRHKLGVLASGHLELLLEVSAVYAAERRQFGRPIGELALVGDLLAESIAHAYALRAAVARAAPLCSPEVADLAAALPEAAICKVLGSEALCAVADAALQIHGGLGYLRGTWVEQSYRDVRVNRIYEGTDEINRRTIAQGLLRAIRRGKLDVAAPAADAARTLVQGGAPPLDAGSPRALAAHVRRLALVGLKACSEVEGDSEPLEGALAELLIAAYAADSAAQRAARAADRYELHQAAAQLACARAVERAHAAYGQITVIAGRAGRPLPTRALSLLDVAPALDRTSLRPLLSRAALDAGRDPLAQYAPIRPPAPDEGAAP